MNTILIHLHPDFSEELESLCKKWNEVQNQLFFQGITPPESLEAKLLSPGAVPTDNILEIASQIRKELNLQSSDTIIVFTEKRIFTSEYYQLFLYGKGTIASISLDFTRKLFSQIKDYHGYIFRALINNILSDLCQRAGLNYHHDTLGCVLDFCNNMPDIIKGIEGGPRLCAKHLQEINRRDLGYLVALVNSVFETKEIIEQDQKISERVLSFDKPVDIGIIIALEEEFKEFFSFIRGREKPVLNEDINQYYYLFSNENYRPYRCVVTFMGGMGPENAALAGDRLIQNFKPKTLVNIGIAGSMDKDIHLGDVIVAEQTDNYLHTAKATNNDKLFTFDFKLSGDPYKTSPIYLNHFRHFRYAHAEYNEKWLNNCNASQIKLINENDRSVLRKSGQLQEYPDIYLGHVASGSIVGASQYFKKWLLDSRDRKYLAIEMESAGILSAAYTRSIATFVIRGISDLANEKKAELDMINSGALRRYAMINSILLFWTFMELNLFERASIPS